MENDLRAALIGWLQGGPEPLDGLNAVTEEAPSTGSPPWLGIAASASADWSTKDRKGREIRVALELHTRREDPAEDGALVRAIDRRVEALPQVQDGFELASVQFLRARAERRPRNTRAVLMEYRFRCFEIQPE